jgi:hypothetical protein
MQGQMVSAEDYLSILNLMGTYQWLVDDGDEDGWANLFVEDGFFAGLGPEPIRGREALKMIPRMAKSYGGNMRHHTGSFSMVYGDTKDVVNMRYYSLVTTWMPNEEPKLFQLALCKTHLVRVGGVWKLKSNTMQGLRQLPGR